MATSIHETVLIGICDGAIDKKKNASYCTNKIGDRPVYCPLAASPYHRTINVFACTSPQCYGKSESWIVLRSQCSEDDIKERQDHKTTQCAEPTMSRTDWCDEADDWGMDDEVAISAVEKPIDSVGEGNDVSSKLQELCFDGGVDHQSAPQSDNVPVFKPFYISVMEETDLDGFQDMDHENELLREYEERERVSVEEIQSCESGEAREEYEKGTAKHGDDTFTGFMKKISLCPEQVLRYSWNGSPLFIMKPPCNASQMVPSCSHCGSLRVFEFQLMPALVSLLGNADTNSEISLEFGTVLVYTCRNSCWKSGSMVPVEEFLFVQPDPDQKYFK